MSSSGDVVKCVVVGLAVMIAGCGGASPQTVVQRRASVDFNCPQEQIKSEEISGGTIKAEGCGQRAVYTCLGGNFGNPYDARCTREPAQSQSSNPPAQ